MKFLVTWRVHEDQRHEALRAFSEMSAEDDQADLGDVHLIGRWHDLQRFTGAAVCETDDPQAIAKWILNWNQVIDCEVTPVLDDAETRAVGQEKLGDD